MDKITYLAELAEGLARWVPERERQDILRYYAEYFEEAGPEREAQVVAELGDPWALSCRLAVEGGYVAQEQANSWTPPKRKRKFWRLAGGIAAAVLLFTVVSIASAASQVGRFVGRFVGADSAVPYVVEGGEYATTIQDIQAEAISGTNTDILFGEVEKSMAGEGFWCMEDGCLDAFTEIDLDVSVANVIVTGGKDYTLSICSDTTLGGYSLKWEIKNGVLKIRDSGASGLVDITNWEDFKNVFGINASAMDVVITVPDVEALNQLQVKTGLGDVFFSDLRMEGTLEAETGLGDVECYDVLTWDKVDLKSGLGDVTLTATEFYSGAEFDLETGMGTVEALLASGRDSVEEMWEYEAKTGMGTVTVDGSDQGSKVKHKGTGGYKLEAESGLGDVHLCFKDNKG